MQGISASGTTGTSPPPGARFTEAWRYTTVEHGIRQEIIAEEIPVALIYNDMTFVVMLATPSDLEDFAVGFSLTEGIVTNPSQISGLETATAGRGIELRLSIPEEEFKMLRRRRRNLTGGSGCGLCGADSFTETLRPVDPLPPSPAIPPQAICRAMAELPARQTLNHDVGAVHAAAFAGMDGHIVAVREDIGRHNALDKLIGSVAKTGIDPLSGFVAVSSRCSYEMAHKTAAAGVPLIASVSAPTALAVEFASDTHLGLAAFAREGRFTMYAASDRILSIP